MVTRHDPKRGQGKVGRRGGAAERRRVFAAAWLANAGNGRAAAQAAGYSGSRHALEVTASRLLRNAEVRAIIETHVKGVEDSMGVPEILQRLTELARSDLTNFVQTITPDMAAAAIEVCGSDADKAKYVLAVIEGRGLGLDLPSAIANGRGQQLKSITFDHDAAGMPKARIEVHDPIKALITLAKIRGILREKDVPPAPPRNAVVIGQLNLLPDAVLEALNDFLEAKAQQALEAGHG